jgi:hypothetical protein
MVGGRRDSDKRSWPSYRHDLLARGGHYRLDRQWARVVNECMVWAQATVEQWHGAVATKGVLDGVVSYPWMK